MKKSLAVLFIAAISCGQAYAQPYGRQYYPSSSVMTSGYRTPSPGNEGFIMAGISGSQAHIDKTTMGGSMPSQTGPLSFQRDYTFTSLGMSCMGIATGSIMPPQGGVAAIEAVAPNSTYNYLMAANFPEGVAVTYLDINGAVVNTVAFRFANAATGMMVRPTITQDPSGAVYVCGVYNLQIYAIKINASGSLAWGNIYSVTGITQPSGGAWPKDMIIDKPTGEVVLVGSVLPGAFYLKLDRNTGNVNVFRTYGPNGDCHFSTIKNTVAGDFVVGGIYLNSSNMPVGNPIMMRLDQAGGIIWNTRLITGVPGQNSLSDIRGIEERVSPNTGQREYYGVTETNNNGCTVYGMSVFKLDGAGIPVPGINEFHYANDAAYSVVNLSINDNGPADVGFHIYTDGSAASVNGHLLQESYFNGVSLSGSCWEMLTACTYAQGPKYMQHQIQLTPAIQQCNNVVTTDVVSGSNLQICLSSSISGGSNWKMTGIQDAKDTKGISIYPNPGNGVYHVELAYDAQLVIYDVMGKEILQTPLKAGSNSISLLPYAPGVYNARISGNEKTETIQLIKE